MNLKSINPVTCKLINEYETYSEQKINLIIEDVAIDFSIWKGISFNKRKDFLLSVANKLKSEINIHSKMISLEMGKPITESKLEVLKSVWVLEYYAQNA